MSNVTTSTKVTGLTAMNVAALRLLNEKADLAVDLTATTATFPRSATDALAALDKARNDAAAIYGTRGHPVASIPAVRRKLVKLTEV